MIPDVLMDLTVKQIIGYAAGVVTVLCAIMEFNKKIKFNPISSILKWIGNKTNAGISTSLKELKDQVDKIDGQVKSLESSIDRIEYDANKREAIQCRVRILQFGDELRTHTLHSKDRFDQVLEDIDVYNRYCNEHPEFKNNQTTVTTSRILDAYNSCLASNNFL